MANGAEPVQPEAQGGPQEADAAQAGGGGGDGAAQVKQVITNVNDGMSLIGEIMQSMGADEGALTELADVQGRFQQLISKVAGGGGDQGSRSVAVNNPGGGVPQSPAGV